MKTGFLDKLLERLDRVDPGSLQTHLLHLAREKGLLETLFHAVREGIVVVDGRGRIGFANRAAIQMLGLQPNGGVGQAIRRYLRDIEWDRLLKLDPDEWSRLVSREIEIAYPEKRIVDFCVVPLSQGEQGAVLLLKDVTSERQREAEQVESERVHALMLLAAGVAHEIGNPLNSLNIHLQLIQREIEALPAGAKGSLGELVTICRREVERLDGVLTRFLKALRPSAPQLAPTSVLDVLQETLDFLKYELENRNVKVEVRAPGELPPIPLDADQIKQAFFNIVRNAMQAMPGGGELRITLRESDRFVEVAFEDTGPGIPREELPRLFEAHYTTRREGMGLGLMIVQRIVRDHGGHIEVRSEPGQGTTFILYLPRGGPRVRLLEAPEKAAVAGETR